MKQTNMMRWIEAAEARSICMLAGEDPARAMIAAIVPQAQPIQGVLARLWEQLCLGEATKRLARFERAQPAE